jgi:hypothetical protein
MSNAALDTALIIPLGSFLAILLMRPVVSPKKS